jgi:hypothetical protein
MKGERSPKPQSQTTHHITTKSFFLEICPSYQVYYPGYQNKKNDMEDACGKYGGEERCIQIFVGKPGGKRPLGREGLEWEANIKT